VALTVAGDVANPGNQLAILVNEENDLGIGLSQKLFNDNVDLFEFLIIHHHLRIRHGPAPRCAFL
jgi:hypothetical protein